MKESIGFIGIGAMGYPMASNLLSSGYEVAAYDIRSEALEAIVERGAQSAASPKEVARACSIVITMLPDSTAVESVVLGKDGVIHAAKSGMLLVDMSSSYPSSTVTIHDALKAKGVLMLDAPVSGGVAGAQKGTLSIMVGGEAETLERCRSVLEALGEKIFHVGPIGAGHAMKALNNMVSAATVVATSEAMVLATKAGLSPDTALAVLNASTGRSWASEYKFPNFVLNGAFNSGFSTGLMYKDLDIATRLAREHRVPVFLASVVQQLYGVAVAQGGETKCHTAVINCLEDWAGVEVRSKKPSA